MPTAIEESEAVKALFFLQTSPVVGPDTVPEDFYSRFMENDENKRTLDDYNSTDDDNNSNGTSMQPKIKKARRVSAVVTAPRSVSIGTRSRTRAEEERERKERPGPALTALLNLNRLGTSSDDEVDPLDSPNNAAAANTILGFKKMFEMKQQQEEAAAKQQQREDDDEEEHEMPHRNARERAFSVAAVEKRFTSDVMSMRPRGKVGAYTLEERRVLITRFLKKRKNRIWKKRVKYDVRKNFADSRLRVKGRFVRKEDEDQLRELLIMTF